MSDKKNVTDKRLMEMLVVSMKDVLLSTGEVLNACHADFDFLSSAGADDDVVISGDGRLTYGQLRKLQTDFDAVVKRMGEAVDPKEIQ